MCVLLTVKFRYFLFAVYSLFFKMSFSSIFSLGSVDCKHEDSFNAFSNMIITSILIFIAWYCRWYTMVHADGSVGLTWEYLKQHGLEGFRNIWPKPSAVAWKIIACFAAFEALLQLALPGQRVEGPISPTGHRPVYKVAIC